MAEINQGRWTAQVEGDFVVFVIGARIQASHPLRSLRDLGGFKRGMMGMLKYLGQHPEKGMLGWQQLGFSNQGQCVAFVERGPKSQPFVG